MCAKSSLGVGGTLNLAWKSADADPVITLHGEWTQFAPRERMVHTETMKLGSGEIVVSRGMEACYRELDALVAQ